jgi:hypothetical protein
MVVVIPIPKVRRERTHFITWSCMTEMSLFAHANERNVLCSSIEFISIRVIPDIFYSLLNLLSFTECVDAAELDAAEDFLVTMVDLSFLEEREEMTRSNYGHLLKKRWEARVSQHNTLSISRIVVYFNNCKLNNSTKNSDHSCCFCPFTIN